MSEAGTSAAHPTAQKLFDARFYAILDAACLAPAQFAPVCRAVLAGGADIVQIRAKGLGNNDYRALLESVMPQFEGTTIPLIVNDHLDIALEYPRCGLHVGQDDTPVPQARAALGPDRILGLSTHSAEQAQKALEMAGLLSYFCIGPVFHTQNQPDNRAVGLETLHAVCKLNRPERLPLFCIGGINRANVAQVCANGARRIVSVSEVLHDANPEEAVRELRITMEEAVNGMEA